MLRMQGNLQLLPATVSSLQLCLRKTVKNVFTNTILLEIEVCRQSCSHDISQSGVSVLLTYACNLCPGSQKDHEGTIMCIETARGHKRIYRIPDSSCEGFDVTDDKAGPAAATLLRPHMYR